MGYRYRAFVSYSHRDEPVARWLQRSLETYRLPRRLRARHVRLGRVFRDRADLASSGSLTESIRQALADSEFLIVLCSPAGRASSYVAEEVRAFLDLRGPEQVLCLIVEGDPRDVIPTALRHAGGEPLAADMRPDADGRANALLKITAGLIGVEFDDLRARHEVRRRRRWAAMAAASTAATAVAVGLAVNATLARQEAEQSRNQAEDLIGFMLTDLREQLEPIGRLEILDAVGDRALRYFAEAGTAGASVMAKRTLALRQIGEIRIEQGRSAGARTSLSEAARLAEKWLAREPGSFQARYQRGLIHFWSGVAHSQDGRDADANAEWQAYLASAERLLALQPASPVARLEVAAAKSNLGVVEYDRRRYASAAALLVDARRVFLSLAEERPEEAIPELASVCSWLGDAHLNQGDLEAAARLHDESIEHLRALGAGEDIDRNLDARLGDALQIAASVAIRGGRLDLAQDRARASAEIFRHLVDVDGSRLYWRLGLGVSQLILAEIAVLEEQPEAALRLLNRAQSELTREGLVERAGDKLAYAEAVRAEALLGLGRPRDALALLAPGTGQDIHAMTGSLRGYEAAIRQALAGYAAHRARGDATAAADWRRRAEALLDEVSAVSADPVFDALRDRARARQAGPAGA